MIDDNLEVQQREKLTIAIDAMGGVNAPFSTISAIKSAIKKHPEVYFLIYGDENVGKMMSDISAISYEFIETKSIVLDTDKPTEVLRTKKDSSMRGAIDALKSKKAAACISSGNTGALMLTARIVLGGISDIKRPAITCLFPTFDGNENRRSVLLDVGANNDCDEIAMSQFAVMGVCFAQAVLKIDNPTVGILNIGTEKMKGRNLEQKTYEILENAGLNFIGYVEGNDVILGKADVVITDGFTGNVFLKASEGAAKMCLDQLRIAIKSSIIGKICGMLLKSSLKKQLSIFDPNLNNGAMFVGINGIVVKSHGSANAFAFENAIDVAINLSKNDINNKIIDGMCHLTATTYAMDFGTEIIDKIKNTSAKIFNFKKEK